MPLPEDSNQKENFLAMLALDNPSKRAEFFGLDLNEASNLQVFDKITQNLLVTIGSEANALILDPDHGLPYFSPKKKKSGRKSQQLFLTLHQPHAEADPLALPKLNQDWDVEAIANNYASAYLEFYYHPAEEQALLKKQFLAEVFDHCQLTDIPLVVKLVIYTPAGEKFNISVFQEAQLQAISELQGFWDTAILQYPQESLACATLTTNLDHPWFVSSQDMEYETFKDILRDALEGGATGFEVGQTIWQEIPENRDKGGLYNLENVEKFIRTTARDRFLELARIVSEHS